MRALLSFSVLSLAASPVLAADPPSPILTTTEAKDVLSYADPKVARVTHVDLDLTADFAKHVMTGTAALDIDAVKGAKQVILDDKKLDIAGITDASGNALQWSVGPADDYKGAPLTVQIGDARRIVIHYTSNPDASALQWLPPELTAGKTRPYLFSQGESINNRSWIPTQDSPGIRQSWSAKITDRKSVV